MSNDTTPKQDHTPGPWKEVDCHELKRNPDKGPIRAIMAGDKIVATIDFDITGLRGVKGDYSRFCDHHEAWANSKLLTAAPDMAGAIEAALNILEMAPTLDYALNAIPFLRDALQLAKGERS